MDSITHAKVKFITDNFKTTTPIKDIVEYNDRPPQDEKNFDKEHVYTCWYQDNKNPELAQYGIQIGEFCDLKESVERKNRPIFYPLEDSVIERYNKEHVQLQNEDDSENQSSNDEEEKAKDEENDSDEEESESKEKVKQNKKKLKIKKQVNQQRILQNKMKKIQETPLILLSKILPNSTAGETKIISLEKELREHKLLYENLKKENVALQARIASLQLLNEELQMSILPILPNIIGNHTRGTSTPNMVLSPIKKPIEKMDSQIMDGTPKSDRFSLRKLIFDHVDIDQCMSQVPPEEEIIDIDQHDSINSGKNKSNLLEKIENLKETSENVIDEEKKESYLSSESDDNFSKTMTAKRRIRRNKRKINVDVTSDDCLHSDDGPNKKKRRKRKDSNVIDKSEDSESDDHYKKKKNETIHDEEEKNNVKKSNDSSFETC